MVARGGWEVKEIYEPFFRLNKLNLKKMAAANKRQCLLERNYGGKISMIN